MAKGITGFDETLYHYVQTLSHPEPAPLRQLREETQALPGSQMQITPEQGQFLALLVKLMAPRCILEIGVFRGYSTLAMALALPPDGRIIACDQDPHATAIALDYWQKAGVKDRITLHVAPAVTTLTHLAEDPHFSEIDLVFIDADKRNYLTYYELVLPLLRPGGLMIIDNVLWFGKVADKTHQDNQTEALRQFNQTLAGDRRIHCSVIPLGDGMTLALKH